MSKGLRADEEFLREYAAKRTRWQTGTGTTSAVVDTQRPAAAPTSGAGNAAGALPFASSAAAGHPILVLPLPPSVNVLYGTARNGQKFLTAEQRQFRARTAEIVRAANRDAFAGRLEMSVTLYFANRRRADIDNRLKAVFDACTHGGAYHDDSQIDVLHVERVVRPGAEEECTVRIGELAA
mgnify:CR=1 FL=1